MITLITGTPGAGKTLYAISNLLRQLVGSKVAGSDENGNPVEVERRLHTNIPRLLLDHELIGPDVGGGLADWQDWCRPGDVIAYDEVQRSWPPRPNGSKVPEAISALETHRHKGVDFIIITQHPMLLDRNVLALVGRHLHVRRFGGIGAALVYEWDHASRQLMYSKALNKSPFRYDKSVFKIYKSAELHTKPKTRIPTLAFVVLAAVLAAVVLIPTVAGRIADKSEHQAQSVEPTKQQAGISPSALPIPGLPAPSAASGGAKGEGAPYDATAFVPVVSYEPLSAPAYDAIRKVVNLPVIVGGACFKGECKCYTAQGTDSGISSAQCEIRVKARPFDPYTVQQVATVSGVGTASAGTPSPAAQTAPVQRDRGSVEPYRGDVSNPHADTLGPHPLKLPPPVPPVPPTDAHQYKPPTLQSPYRKG